MSLLPLPPSSFPPLPAGFSGRVRWPPTTNCGISIGRLPRRSPPSSRNTPSRLSRPPGLRRDQRHAADAGSASSFLDPRAYARMREQQEGLYFGLGLRSCRSTATSPSRGCSKDRPRSHGIRRGDVIAHIESESAKGWTSEKRCGNCGAEGHVGQHRRAPQRPRTSDSADRHARRDQHPEPEGVVHDRAARPATRPLPNRRAHRRRSGARARRHAQRRP